MAVYLVQHGKALTEAEDVARPLSKKGIEETRLVAKQMKRRGVVVAKIYHSGKLRAQQTAEIFFEMLVAKSINEIAGLKPNDDPDLLHGTLDFNNTLYVGHLPHLNKLTSKLLCGDEGEILVAFENSAVLALSKESASDFTESNEVKVAWYLTPEVC